jgi:hypothetical protein
LTSASTAVFLDEYTPTGNLVQSIAVPTAASGLNNPLTSSGTAGSEGQITVSSDGQYVALTGYDAAPGVASISGTKASADARDIGILNTTTGSVDTSTAPNNWSDKNNPRSAVTEDGTNIWTADATDGAAYTTLGSTGAGMTLLNQSTGSATNGEFVNIFNNQLYMSTQKGSTLRISLIGTGTPTTAVTDSQLPGLTIGNDTLVGTTDLGPDGFILTSLDGSATPDVLYIADNLYNSSSGSASAALGGIEKFTLAAGSWTLDGVVPLAGVTGLTIAPTAAGTTDTLYATNGTGIYSISDNGSSLANDTAAEIVAAPTNEAFRGIAAVPEPASVTFLLAGTASLLLRRSRDERRC